MILHPDAYTFPGRVRFVSRNFLKLRDDPLLATHANVIYLYLLPEALALLEPILVDVVAERKQKACQHLRIVTFMFHFENWVATEKALFGALRLYS